MAAPALIRPEVRDLAARIYGELVCRSVVLTGNSVQIGTSAEGIARLSFKLAESFRQVEDSLNAESLPKNQDFKLDTSDLAAWTKK